MVSLKDMQGLSETKVSPTIAELQHRVAMIYDPGTGKPDVAHTEAAQYRRYQADVAWLFDPWTGRLRAAQSVSNDVFGELIRPPTHFTNLLNGTTWTHWITEPTAGSSVPCHTRVIDGILCRYWGNETPKGRVLLDAFITDCIQKGFMTATEPPEQPDQQGLQ